jgi:thiamine-monophosphate kinase
MKDKEQILINKLRSPHIGDDGAVVGNMVYSADAFCEDIHFRRGWMTPAQIGRKAMLVNLSDAVAMNATPRYALVTLSLPQHFTETEMDELIGALEATASQWHCEIIGGDTVGGEKLNLSITIISHSDMPLFRTGLQAGDLLAYTGTLGESRRDFLQLEAGGSIPRHSRFYVPNLRAEFIREARPWLRVGMDISDGLFCDTNKLLDTNKYGFEILMNIDDETGASGEEYEMLIGFNSKDLNRVKEIAERTQTPLNIFAKTTQNIERFSCLSHHFG